MSKYNELWMYIKEDGSDMINLTFDEIKNIIGIDIDHSFLTYKKDLLKYGYQVKKISLKEKFITFIKNDEE